MSNVWDDFGKLVTLKVIFPDEAAAKKATIFGNGNNQVPVSILLHVNDKEGESISLAADELLKVLSLVNYSTGEKIAFDGVSSNIKYWNASAEKSEYSSPLSYDINALDKVSDVSDSDDYLTLYVSASDLSAEIDIDIAVQVDVPGVGVFNTTSEGTDTRNGPGGQEGSVFKAPSYVHIHARLPIDYSNIENLTLQQGPWTLIDNQDFVVHDYIIDSAYWEKDNARLYSCNAKVIPREQGIEFVSTEYHYITFKDTHAHLSTVVWHHENEPGFIYEDIYEKSADFVAVAGFGKSLDNPNHDIYIWFPPKNDSSMKKGYYHLIDSEWQYRTTIDFAVDYQVDLKTPSIMGYKITVPTGENVGVHGWNSVYSPVTFSVIDNYGNKSEFKAKFFSDRTSYKTVGNLTLE